jgi:peptidoglycan/xylan/chitin deacetylase (PgdA/CDA1 family)
MKNLSTTARVLIVLAILLIARVAYLTWQRSLIPELRAASVPVLPLQRDPIDFLQQFPEAFALQVAVLWTDASHSPLSLVHAFRQMGIPFFITADLDQALRHRHILIFPDIDATTFSETQAQQLLAHAEDGGTIFAQNVFWGVFKPIFGFYQFLPLQTRQRVTFDGRDPILRYLDRPEEKEVWLKGVRVTDAFWTNGYLSDESSEIVARFNDGTPALLGKSVGKGRVYLCGVNLDDVILRNQTNRDFEAHRHYVNGFEPGTDVWLLILRAWYEAAVSDWVRVATMPQSQRSVVLLSHNVDWDRAVRGAAAFAAMEKKRGVASTFFIQTKYVNDGTSWGFFLGQNLDRIRQLKTDGFELGSHSVVHPHVFHMFPVGTGEETFASYRPYAQSARRGLGGTVFGEVRVSKELLDGEIPQQNTRTFRAAHLHVPSSLPEVLQRSGYEFDSSFTTGEVLTNFPYALPLDLGFEQDSGIYEFPIALEDEEGKPLAQQMTTALEVIRANADNGAPTGIMIDPDDPKRNLPVEDTILNSLPAGVATSTVESFAQFWRARDRLWWRVDATDDPQTILLTVKAEEEVRGLAFDFARKIDAVMGEATLGAEQRRVIFPLLPAAQQVTIQVQYLPGL